MIRNASLLCRWFLALVLPFMGLTTAQGQAETPPARSLVFSDIHFDPFVEAATFQRLRLAPVEEWNAILRESGNGAPSPRGEDSNAALLWSFLDDAAARLPNPDFILCPGDLLSHDWIAHYDSLAPKNHRDDPAAYEEFTARVMRFLAREIRQRFPNTPIIATFGNNDSDCGDYQLAPNGPFLQAARPIWREMLGNVDPREGLGPEFERLGCYWTTLPNLARHRIVVLNSVFFSPNYQNACGDAVVHPADEALAWLERTLGEARARDEYVWLLMHIPPGIDSFYTARNRNKNLPPVTLWNEDITKRFLAIVDAHRDAVPFAFAGHTHRDDFRVTQLNGAPLLAVKIVPAISPIYNNNPGYQIYDYDPATGTVWNYQTYYLANLDLAATGDAVPEWRHEYDFRASYGLERLDAHTITRLERMLEPGSMPQKHYERYYGVGVAPELTPGEFPYYRCAITNILTERFTTCVGSMR